MDANVIDTLKFADRLKEAGFESPRAEGLARALGEELGARVLTPVDRDAIHVSIDGLGTRIDGLETRIDGLEAKFDARFEGVEAKFEGMEAKFDGLQARFEALDTKLDVQHESVKVQLASMGANFKLLVAMFAVGFTLVFGVGLYNVVA